MPCQPKPVNTISSFLLANTQFTTPIHSLLLFLLLLLSQSTPRCQPPRWQNTPRPLLPSPVDPYRHTHPHPIYPLCYYPVLHPLTARPLLPSPVDPYRHTHPIYPLYYYPVLHPLTARQPKNSAASSYITKTPFCSLSCTIC